jgi:hypothetical protein
MNRQCHTFLRRREPLLPPYMTWGWVTTKDGERVKRSLVKTVATQVNKGKVYPYASWRQGDKRWW